MTTTTIRQLTATTFDEAVLAADRPVVVDVWAEWCPPCRAIAPVLEAIATDHAGALLVYGINGDDHPDIVRRFEVLGVPTLLVFDAGELVNRIVGARGKGRLLQDLAPVLNRGA